MDEDNGFIGFEGILDTQLATTASILRGLCAPDAISSIAKSARTLAENLRSEKGIVAAFMTDFANFLEKSAESKPS